MTTRVGGISEGPYAELNLGGLVGDRYEAVAENRRRLEEISSPIQWLDQHHGSEIFEATRKSPDLFPVADAVWTSVPGLAIGVLTADCFRCSWRTVEGRSWDWRIVAGSHLPREW